MKIRRVVILFVCIFLLPVDVIFATSVKLQWDSNSEPDIAGYKIHYGFVSQDYRFVIDVGDVQEYQIDNLYPGKTYYFSLTAYDTVHNESMYSEEVSITIPIELKTIKKILALNNRTIQIFFSEKMDAISISDPLNYSITPAIPVISAEPDSNMETVTLVTGEHQVNMDYTITCSNLRIQESLSILDPITKKYQATDLASPFLTGIHLVDRNTIEIVFNEPLDAQSVNNFNYYSITPFVEIFNVSLDPGKTKITLSTSSHSPLRKYQLEVRQIKDVNGNEIEGNLSISYSFSNPESPFILGTEIMNPATINIYFSEKMDYYSITDKQHYTIQPNLEIYSIAADSSLQKVTLFTQDHDPSKSYTLRAEGLMSFLQSKMEKSYVYTYTIIDEVPPFVKDMKMLSRSNIELYFSERVERSSLMELSNYRIDPSIQINSVDVDELGRKVILQTQPHVYDQRYTFEMHNIHDLAQNQIPPFYAIVYEYHIPSQITSINKVDYQAEILQEGDNCYTDEDIQLADIPTELQEQTWIKTKNGDKFCMVEDFLNFQVDDDVIVYVGYDEKSPVLPTWLESWTSTSSRIKTSDDSYFRCYMKTFPAGNVVLGGNYSIDQNSSMYTVVVKPVHSSSINYPDLPDQEPINNRPKIAEDYKLYQNYPNPFNPATEISFYTKVEEKVTLTIFDLMGRVVRKFEMNITSPGRYAFTWNGESGDGQSVSSGIYFYQLKSPTFEQTKKMTLLH